MKGSPGSIYMFCLFCGVFILCLRKKKGERGVLPGDVFSFRLESGGGEGGGLK